MKICINIGHSEIDSGATSVDGKTEEHEFNENELVPYISMVLRKLGHEVIVMEQIKSFGELPGRINKLNPDIILSIHSNWAKSNVSGTETLYYFNSRRGKYLAQCLQEAIVDCLDFPDRGIKALTSGDRGYILVAKTKAPCVLLEPFFISNTLDLARVRSKLQLLGIAIGSGITKYLRLHG
jgi:N-acetylmuramoyl-L-alanine amidase